MKIGRAVSVVSLLVAIIGPASISSAQNLDLQPVTSTPAFGTYYSLQKILAGTNEPPLPFDPFPDLTLYSLTLTDDGGATVFVYDDLAVDYEALQQDSQAAQAGAQPMSSGGPPMPGGGGGGPSGAPRVPPLYTLNEGLCLVPPVISGGSLVIVITNVGPGWTTNSYDLFYTTNLALLPSPALCLTNWAWITRSAPGQTNFTVSNLPSSQCYFRLGTMLDTDGDGVTDAYEMLVSHTDPKNAYSNLDGLLDSWEVALGLNPQLNNVNQVSERATYGYTSADWLNAVSGTKAGTINPDNEGNVLSVSQ